MAAGTRAVALWSVCGVGSCGYTVRVTSRVWRCTQPHSGRKPARRGVERRESCVSSLSLMYTRGYVLRSLMQEVYATRGSDSAPTRETASRHLRYIHSNLPIIGRLVSRRRRRDGYVEPYWSWSGTRVRAGPRRCRASLSPFASPSRRSALGSYMAAASFVPTPGLCSSAALTDARCACHMAGEKQKCVQSQQVS